ncbi:hypothetical protein T492DRAFT_1072032 [Pavlovales sp. CCMP2436]|nr:hypothetical protein T492DRAFT_1072032 [Pavlovales sp. CCMP2436]
MCIYILPFSFISLQLFIQFCDMFYAKKSPPPPLYPLLRAQKALISLFFTTAVGVCIHRN